MALASLLIDLQLNSASLREGLDSAKAKLTSFGAGVSKAFAGVEDMAKSVKRASNDVAQAGLGLAAVASGAVALAATVDKGIANEVKNLKNSFTDLAVPIAQMVVPAMRDMAASVRSVADWVAGLSPHAKAMISNFLQIAAVVGGAALVISKVAAAVGALAGIIAAITAAPLLMLVGGLAAIAAGALFLHKVWRENWGGIQEKTRGVLTAIAGYWSQFKDFLGGLWDGLIDGYGKVMKFALNTTVTLLQSLGKVSKAQAELQIRGNNLGVDIAMNALKGGALKTAALEFGTSMKDGVLGAASALKEELALIMKGFSLDNGGSAARHGGPAVAGSTPSSGHDAMADFYMDAAQQKLDEAAAKLAANIKENSEFINRGLRFATAQRLQAEETFSGRIRAAVVQIGESLGSAVKTVAGKMGAAGDLITGAVEGFKSGGPIGAVIGIIVGVFTKLEGFGKIVESINNMLNRAFGRINTALNPLFNAIINIAEAIGSLIEVVTSLSRSYEIVGGTMKVIGLAINFAANGIMIFAANLAGTVRDIMKAFGMDTTGITKTINEMWMKIVKTAADMKSFDLFEDGKTKPAPTLEDNLKNPGAFGPPDVQKVAVVNFSEMMTNLPSGYKVKGAQFGADDAGGPIRDAQGAWSNGDDLTAKSGTSSTGPGVDEAWVAVAIAQASGSSEALAAAMANLTHAIEQAARDKAEAEGNAQWAADPYGGGGGSGSSSGALTGESTRPGGGVNFYGPVQLFPKGGFAQFVQEMSEMQQAQMATKSRNPSKAKMR